MLRKYYLNDLNQAKDFLTIDKIFSIYNLHITQLYFYLNKPQVLYLLLKKL